MLKILEGFWRSALNWLCGFPSAFPSQLPSPTVKLVWVGGFPAHYMAEFHSRLEKRFASVGFLYVPYSMRGSAFDHEVVSLPDNLACAPRRWKWLWCWRSLEFSNPDAVLIAGSFPRMNLIAAAWALKRRRRIYYVSDSNLLDEKNLRRSFINKLLLGVVLARVNMILCIGSRNSEFYLQYIKRERLGEVLLRFPLPHLHSKFESIGENIAEGFTFLFFGRLESVKAIDRIISAYAMLDVDLRNGSRLLIAGDGSMKQGLEEQVAKLGIADRVQFLGAIPSDEAPAVFEQANALILASSEEPWGLVVNEALSAGIPVVGPFWIGAFADLVIHGVTGFVTKDNSPAELAKAMRTLSIDPSLAALMGQTGRVLVREQGWTIDGSLDAIAQLPEFKD